MTHEDLPVKEGKIAIVGLALRAPGAVNEREFWKNLCEGTESIQFFNEDNLIRSGTPAEWLRDPHFVPAAGLIKDGEFFDSELFGFTEKEANLTDPQQRVFLECAWEALEDAGYAGEHADVKIGIYAGCGYSSYWLEQVVPSLNSLEMASRYHALLANDKDFLSSRVAYKLNLKGPAVTVQSACSTSLVAVHLACQSLLSGDCDVALAGGVSLRTAQPTGYLFEEGMILSPDGHCRAFDADAAGTVPGSGSGVVVLKRLEDAVADGDSIRAVILASAINNDGSTKMGFTAPGVEGQAAVIQEALAVSGASPDSIGYVEAHGTGTAVGDPIEIAALNKAFRAVTDKPASVALGSLKANIGHADAAAGVLGLIKTVLMLQEQRIPPVPHFRQPNPKADFNAGPFYVNVQLRKWAKDRHPRRAGVSSFGLGGTNAHVILEEAPAIDSTHHEDAPHLLLLSAKSHSALDAATARLASALERSERIDLADAAFTLRTGRRSLPFRRAVVCRNTNQAAELLPIAPSGMISGPAQLAWLFPGEGTIDPAILAKLQTEPVFREWIRRCDELLPGSFLAQEIALAKVWLSWGVRPEALLGYGIAEYVAASLAGVFSIEDGLRLAAARQQLLTHAPVASLVAVSLSERKLQPFLGHGVSLYATHTPAESLVAVAKDALGHLLKHLNQEKVQYAILADAFPVIAKDNTPLHACEAAIRSVNFKAPDVPLLSSISGRWISDEEATDADYWISQLGKPVRFSESLDRLLQEPSRILLEVGPAQNISRLARQHPGRSPRQVVISSLEGEPLHDALGRLWVSGINPEQKGFASYRSGRRINLPSYPFERKRHWIDKPLNVPQIVRSEKLEPENWFYIPSWKRSVPMEIRRPTEARWLLLADDCGLALHIARWLKEQNHSAIIVEPGETFTATGTGYAFNPESSQDYEMLFAALGEQNFPDVIVHCLQVTGEQSRNSAVDSYASLVALAKALDLRTVIKPLRVEMISTGMQTVLGREEVHPRRAMTIGAALAMEQELEGIRCRFIDLEVPSPLGFRDPDMEALKIELATPATEREVAFRNSQRWQRNYERVQLPEPKAMSAGGDVYFITGGLGVIGKAIADYLVNKTGAKVSLVSRRRPASETHSAYLMLQADVADEEQLRRAWEITEKHYGRIDCVIHAAGLVDTKSFHLLAASTPERAEAHFRAKVYGTDVIGRLLQENKTPKCFLFSSLSSVLGGVGYGSYAAANRFLDAWAEAKQTEAARYIAIDWDGWNTTGKHVVRSGKNVDFAMTLDEGVHAFARILFAQRNLTRVIVSTGDLDLRISQRAHIRVAEPKETIAEHIDYTEMSDTEQRLVSIWHSVLGGKPVGIAENFFDRGADSLHAAQILARIRQAFQVELPIEAIFRNQTVDSLAREIDRVRAIADEETVEVAL